MSIERDIENVIANFCTEIVALVRVVADEEIEAARVAAARSPPVTARPPRLRAKPPGVGQTAAPLPSSVVPPKLRRLEKSSTPPPRAPEEQPTLPDSGVAAAVTPAAASSLVERLRLFVEARAAYSARELADAIGVRTVDVIDPLRVLVEAGRIHKRIEGGQARYHADAPPLDEDDEEDERPAVAHVLQETRRASVIRRAPPGP